MSAALINRHFGAIICYDKNQCSIDYRYPVLGNAGSGNDKTPPITFSKVELLMKLIDN
jgi:hypothetical protein